MSSPISDRRTQRGMGLYLFMLILAFLMPAVLILVRGSVQQNRFARRDSNIKTARQMAESINNDFMNSFTEDWHRNAFDTLYLTHNNPNYASMGSATSNKTVARSSSTIRIQTIATYDKGGILGVGHPFRAEKGVDALFFWVSDAFKFDYVWNQSVRVGNQINRDFVSTSLTAANTIFVGGELHAGDVDWPLTGRWIVKGRFTDPLNVTKNNGIIYCSQVSHPANPTPPGTEIQVFTPNTMRPNLFVLSPEGAGIPGDLGYYALRRSTEIVVMLGESVGIELTAADQFIRTPLDGSGNPTGEPSQTVNYFSEVLSATVPFTLSVRGGDVYLSDSVVSRPITVSVVGGNVTVLGNVRYAFGALAAGDDRSFALLAEENIILNSGSGSPQILMGFYGAINGSFTVQGNQNINVTGTLYGPIGFYALPPGFTLNVSADPQLGRFPPPLYPRRPRVVMWDYVP